MDRDFTPTAEMLVHEFDDEATLDEEEEIEPLDSQLIELADLQRVSFLFDFILLICINVSLKGLAVQRWFL